LVRNNANLISLSANTNNINNLSFQSSNLLALSANTNSINAVASKNNFLYGNIYSNINNNSNNIEIFNLLPAPQIFSGYYIVSITSGNFSNIYLPQGYTINSFNISANIANPNLYGDIFTSNILSITTNTSFNGKINYFIIAN
jgi:hypothetical protein